MTTRKLIRYAESKFDSAYQEHARIFGDAVKQHPYMDVQTMPTVMQAAAIMDAWGDVCKASRKLLNAQLGTG